MADADVKTPVAEDGDAAPETAEEAPKKPVDP
jgi:hypothetical protein